MIPIDIMITCVNYFNSDHYLYIKHPDLDYVSVYTYLRNGGSENRVRAILNKDISEKYIEGE